MNTHPLASARLVGWSLAAAFAAMPLLLPLGAAAQALQPGQTRPAAPEPAAAPAAPSRVTDWINRTYPADKEMPVVAAPAVTAGIIGHFRPGAEVLVLGVVAGGEWLQIRLPDGTTLGYVRSADFPSALGKAPSPVQPAAPPPAVAAASPPPVSTAAPAIAAAAPLMPPPEAVPAAGAANAVPAPQHPASLVPVLALTRPIMAPPPPAASAPPPAMEAPSAAAGEPPLPPEISGPPRVIDSATLLVNGQLIPLFGVQGLDGDLAAGMAAYITSGGNSVTCRLREPPRYTCVLPGGADLGMAALINGAALLGPEAPGPYVAERDDAVRNRRGVWANVAIPAFSVPPELPPTLLSPYLAWTTEFPLWPFEALGPDAYVIDSEPWAYVDGGWQAMAYDPGAGGWGYRGADGGWHGARGEFRDRFDHRFPRGEGLRGGMMHAGLRGGFAEHGREGFRGGEGFHGGMAGHSGVREAAARGFTHPHAAGGFGPGRGGMGMDHGGFGRAGFPGGARGGFGHAGFPGGGFARGGSPMTGRAGGGMMRAGGGGGRAGGGGARVGGGGGRHK